MQKILLLFTMLLIIGCPSFIFCNNFAGSSNEALFTKYELWWNLNRFNKVESILIYQGNDVSTCKDLQSSIDNAIQSGGSKEVKVRIAAAGSLMLVNSIGNKKVIDITEIGYFLGGVRSLDKLFYSEQLSNTIEAMINKSIYNKEIKSSEEYFKNMQIEFYKSRKG